MKMRHVQTAIWQGWTANLLMIVLVSVAQADSIEGSFSNDFGELIYSRDAGLIGLKDQELAIGLFLNEDNNVVPHFTLSTEVLKDKLPIQFAIGGRGYFLARTQPRDDGGGGAVGGHRRYKNTFFRPSVP